MNRVLIFQHIVCEGPGYMGDFMQARGIPYRIIRIDEGEQVPADALDAAGLVFLGGPMSVNDDLGWVREELALIEAAQDRAVPMLGHCLGAQLISRALGGEVTANAVTEIGWFPVRRNDSKVAKKWLGALPASFDVFHMHGEKASLPDGATLLLANDHCPNQGFVLGKTLALQCHIEVTAPILAEWVAYYADDLKLPSESVQSPAAILADCEQRVRRLQAIAGHMYAKWFENIAITNQDS